MGVAVALTLLIFATMRGYAAWHFSIRIPRGNWLMAAGVASDAALAAWCLWASLWMARQVGLLAF